MHKIVTSINAFVQPSSCVNVPTNVDTDRSSTPLSELGKQRLRIPVDKSPCNSESRREPVTNGQVRLQVFDNGWACKATLNITPVMSRYIQRAATKAKHRGLDVTGVSRD